MGDYAAIDRVSIIFEDSEQVMWIGMSRPYSGIYIFDREKETFKKYLLKLRMIMWNRQ